MSFILYLFSLEERHATVAVTRTSNLVKTSSGESGSAFLISHEYELQTGGSSSNKTDLMDA